MRGSHETANHIPQWRRFRKSAWADFGAATTGWDGHVLQMHQIRLNASEDKVPQRLDLHRAGTDRTRRTSWTKIIAEEARSYSSLLSPAGDRGKIRRRPELEPSGHRSVERWVGEGLASSVAAPHELFKTWCELCSKVLLLRKGEL